MLKAGIALAVTATAACEESHPGTASTADLDRLRLLASLEVSALEVYAAVANGIHSGRLGQVNASVSQFVDATSLRHRLHLDAWNSLLAAAKHTSQAGPDLALQPELHRQLQGAHTLHDALASAVYAEQLLTATAAVAAFSFSTSRYRSQATRTAAVEAQHRAILEYLMAVQPIDADFVATGAARPLSDLGT